MTTCPSSSSQRRSSAGDPTPRSPEFKQFIVSLLRRLDLTARHVEVFTDEESMEEFSKAFTHRTYSRTFNYEQYEFLGDTVVNDAVAFYISQTFPEIQNVAWMTRIKHTLISKKYLANLAYQAGFLNHIRFGELQGVVAAAGRANAALPASSSKELLSLLEDCFEAFIGCLREVVNRRSSHHAGCVVARLMVTSFINKNDVPTAYDDIFDAKSRLKEVYDKYHWGFSVRAAGQPGCMSASMVVSREPNGATRVRVFGFPLGTKQRLPQNRYLLCTSLGPSKDTAQQIGAKTALGVLEKQFQIYETRSTPS